MSPSRATILVLLVAILLACDRTSGPPRRDATQKRVGFSILEDYDKGEDLAEIAKDFDLFKELGVSTWRGSFGWDDYEPSRGNYDFAWLHRFAELAASRGLTLRPYIGYTPDWAAAGGSDKEVWNDPPRNLDDWYRFTRTLAAEMRRHRNIVSYEIYNEENVKQWWDGPASAYRDVLRRGADGIRAGNPDAQVLLGGLVYPDVEWIEAVCDSAESSRRIDVIPFHAYPETWTPPDVTVENYLGVAFNSAFVTATDAACGKKPLWINETGYATTPGRTEADQAGWWARAIATFLGEPRIEHIGIYEIKDLRPDRAAIGDTPNYHLGLTRANREKKLAFGTVARLVSLLGNHDVSLASERLTVTASPSAAGLYRHLFVRADGQQVLFLWTRTAEAIVDIDLPSPASTATEYALDGALTGRLEIVGRRLRRVTLTPNQVRIFEIAR